MACPSSHGQGGCGGDCTSSLKKRDLNRSRAVKNSKCPAQTVESFDLCNLCVLNALERQFPESRGEWELSASLRQHHPAASRPPRKNHFRAPRLVWRKDIDKFHMFAVIPPASMHSIINTHEIFRIGNVSLTLIIIGAWKKSTAPQRIGLVEPRAVQPLPPAGLISCKAIHIFAMKCSPRFRGEVQRCGQGF